MQYEIYLIKWYEMYLIQTVFYINSECTAPEVRYGALSEDALFKPGTTISGSCDTGYASITGVITASCDVNYQATIVGTCKQRK